MAEKGSVAVNLHSSSNHHTTSPFSPPFRVRFADHPISGLNPIDHYELEEDDVDWSPELYSDVSSAEGDSPDSANSDSGGSDSSPIFPSDLRRRPFQTDRFGLSAVLSENRGPPLHQRRQAINVPVRKAALEAEVSRISHQSAPMNIPAWPRGRRQPAVVFGGVDDDEDEDGAVDMLPPHVIVARSHVMTFSVFEGVGRTLKGRDLRRVRNAVFQKTGFLD